MRGGESGEKTRGGDVPKALCPPILFLFRYYITRNGSLVIPATRLEDEGTYRAVLRNGAGEMAAEIPLSFLFETSCHTSCLNEGTCVDISVCMCPAEYRGTNCEIDNLIGMTRCRGNGSNVVSGCLFP